MKWEWEEITLPFPIQKSFTFPEIFLFADGIEE